MRWLALFLLAFPRPAEAATGCSLRNPDEDIRSFFPEVTDYVVHSISFRGQGVDHQELGRRISDDLDSLYETDDVPYSLYIVHGKGETLGYVFGTNQRGRYSNIQVIAVTDVRLSLKSVYLQTLRSPAHESLQSTEFLSALAAQNLVAFPGFASCYRDGDCSAVPVSDPTGGAEVEDYRHILRGLAKLSILREVLLQPGTLEPPKSRPAQAEWIGNHQGVEHSRKVERNPQFDSLEDVSLAPDEPVIAWNHGQGVRAYPLSVMQKTSVVLDRVGEQRVAVVWSAPSQTAAVFTIQDQDAFHFSGDLLFGHRVLVDEATGSQWSLQSGESVYGARAGEALLQLPGVQLTNASALKGSNTVALKP